MTCIGGRNTIDSVLVLVPELHVVHSVHPSFGVSLLERGHDALHNVFAAALLFCMGTIVGQSNPPGTEAQSSVLILQSILAEIRQFRQDSRASSTAFQRAQILLHRVQLQDSVVRRLQDKLDDARQTLTGNQAEDARIAVSLKQEEDFGIRIDNAEGRRQFEEMIAQLKSQHEMQTKMAQEAQGKVTDYEDQLRLEQAKLERLQDELDRLDKTLQESASNK